MGAIGNCDYSAPSSSGNAMLSGWAFGPQSVLWSGTASLTFENATFTNVENSSGLRLSGDLLLIGVGILGRGQDLSITNTVGDLDLASLNTGNDGASPSDGSVIWSHYGTVQTVTITENSVFNSSFVQAFVPYQTTPLTLSIGASGNNGSVSFIGGMSSLNVTSLSGNNTTYEFNGPFDVASVDNILQKAIDGNITGSSIAIEGDSASPTVTSEVDTLTVVGYSSTDSGMLAFNNGASVLINFDDTSDLVDSHVGGFYPALVFSLGIADSPSLDDVAAKLVEMIGDYLQTLMSIEAVNSGPVITLTLPDWSTWFGSYSDISGSPFSFVNIQTGVDRVAFLVNVQSNSVTTN